jgi:hypothetical protein
MTDDQNSELTPGRIVYVLWALNITDQLTWDEKQQAAIVKQLGGTAAMRECDSYLRDYERRFERYTRDELAAMLMRILSKSSRHRFGNSEPEKPHRPHQR